MMKIITLNIIIVTISFSLFGQVDRSRLPDPGVAREIKIGDYEKFKLKNGLNVFVIENRKLPRVTFRLVFDLEPVLEGDKAGYLQMVGQMLKRGTTSRSKEQLDQEIDFIGASISAGPSFVYASGLSKYSEKVIELMTDILFNPTFPEEELEKIRTQTLSNLASEKDDPNTISANVISKIVYGSEHPYGELSTEETVGNITIDDIRTYHATYFKPNTAYLAVVGDISKKDAQTIVKKYFGSWKIGEIDKPKYNQPILPSTSSVAIVNRAASVQSTINVTYPIELKPATEDVIPVRIMNEILGGGMTGRLFMNLREDKGYTYGSYSSLETDDLIARFNASASVRNEVTDSSITEILNEIKRMTIEPVSSDELNLAKNAIAGNFARGLENPQTVASIAINTELYDLPDDYYSTYLKRVQLATAEDILSISKKYLKPENAYITVVGKASEIENGLIQFGEVNYYDFYGNILDPSKAKLPEGLTGEIVIEDYVNAIGGLKKLKEVKTLRMVMTADAMGTIMQLTKSHNESKLNITIKVADNIMSEQRFDGTNGQAYQMGQLIPLTDEQQLGLKLEAAPFPEINFDEMGVTVKLIGVEEISGEDCYVIEVINPDESKYSLYFNSKSKLLMRKSNTMDVQGQSMTFNTDFSDYKEVSGILFAHKIKIPLGPGFQAESTMQSLELNIELADDLFKID